MKDLEALFTHTLRDMYYAERKILKALPKMARKAHNQDLRGAFEKHQGETEQHVERLENVFEQMGIPARGVTCEAIQGILEEAEEIMSEAEDGATRDAGMIAAAQAVEHYEIARYGTLVAWARDLGMKGAVEVLEKTLAEEKQADDTLTEIAERSANPQAA